MSDDEIKKLKDGMVAIQRVLIDQSKKSDDLERRIGDEFKKLKDGMVAMQKGLIDQSKKRDTLSERMDNLKNDKKIYVAIVVKNGAVIEIISSGKSVNIRTIDLDNRRYGDEKSDIVENIEKYTDKLMDEVE